MRKICVFTGSRAEYGLLYWVMRFIQDDPDLQLQVLVTGAHLSDRLGATYRQIEADGFQIDVKVSMNLENDSGAGLATAMGEEMAGVAKALDDLQPDIFVILGDRYEAFAAAATAMMLRLPIAHIHGGEATEGQIDEAIRHSITKMSHLHFAAAEEYRNRIIQLGEDPKRVFTVGAPGLDHIENTVFMDRKSLSESIGFELKGDVFLITYHPPTLDKNAPSVNALIDALDAFPDVCIVFTKANADMGGQAVNERLAEYVAQHTGRMILTSSLGQLRYLSLVNEAQVVIGNSSSGLIEVPSIGTPTINIGDRQQGRLRAVSVIDCEDSRDGIRTAIKTAQSDGMQTKAAKCNSPYGKGGASKAVVNIIKAADLDGILVKSFHDLEVVG
ncbi:MAG: UDP-N-acetylglucosamine 2-epimerase (hydrolyzing) [Phycisphaeraceae bacterium]|nr:UDP-N-acetylglucosamine 2-epimerase (hydrolyzing) [Phycisphaeraceae bacterium]